MVTVGGFTVLVKLAAAAKEMVLAHQFGTSDALDAFLMASVLPNFAANLIAGSLNVALIPAYVLVYEKEGGVAAQRLLATMMVLTVGFLFTLALLLGLTGPYVLPFLASGFSSEKLVLTNSLLYLLLSTLVLVGLTTIWGAVLNAWNRFALVATVPTTTSIAIVVLVVVMVGHWGIYALVAGTVGGALIEAGLLGWRLTKEGVSLVPRWYGVSPAVKQVLEQYSPVVASSFLIGCTGVASQAMAAMLSPGSVSVLAYGNKVTGLIIGVGAIAVSTAALPHFSRIVSMTDWLSLRHTLMTHVRLLLIITVPLTIVLICFSEPLVAIVFQRGAFTEADTRMVGQVQAMYLLQVPPYVVSMLFVRLISALKANRFLMWSSTISLVLYMILVLPFMQWLGVAGIALAWSVMCLLACLFMWIVSMRLINERMRQQG
jgi:putative peptidoglycan lipid II flippase